MEQVLNRIKNSIMDSVAFIDSKMRASHFMINDKRIKYDHDLVYEMMTKQHNVFRLLMELKHTVRELNKKSTLRILEKFCVQFTALNHSKQDVLFPLLHYAYAENEKAQISIQQVHRDYESMLANIQMFCEECKQISNINSSNVDDLLLHLDDAIAQYVEYNNDEEHYLHSLYNQIPNVISNKPSTDILKAG